MTFYGPVKFGANGMNKVRDLPIIQVQDKQIKVLNPADIKNGDMVVPDLAARVTLMNRDNKVIEHLGDDSASEWQTTRIMSRDRFTPGKFIAPHGACFDHEGNIFVVEWVEVGRVTKLRKV